MTMHQILRIIIDTLFPPTVHGMRLARATPTLVRRHYHEQRMGFIIALSHYHTPLIQAAIAACKFEKNKHAAELLSHLLDTWLDRHPHEGATIVIPLPLSSVRHTERGFNQVERVITYCKNLSPSQTKTDWLRRTIDTQRQTSLDRAARLQNMVGVFSTTEILNQVDWTKISRIIICDDVITTGASLAAAKATLLPQLPAHVELICLAWAH